MILPPGIHQFKAFAKLLGEACRIVAGDRQPAALLRAVDGERPDDDMAAGAERLRHARWLLANTAHPITQICLDVGYESLGSFSWLFAQRYGLSPQAFRILNR